jgi:hypothetical protein
VIHDFNVFASEITEPVLCAIHTKGLNKLISFSKPYTNLELFVWHFDAPSVQVAILESIES